MRISDITPDVLFRAYAARGWKLFAEGDYNLNIIGIRADDRKSNTFNDLICLLYKTDGRWVLRKYAATTDPGLYYRQNPLNPRGTAILKDGYYRGAFGIGLHPGSTAALCRPSPCRCGATTTGMECSILAEKFRRRWRTSTSTARQPPALQNLSTGGQQAVR